MVTDASTQAPVAKALVTSRGAALPGHRSAMADERGAFEIARLPAGTHVLTVEREGVPEARLEVNPPSHDLPVVFSDKLTPPVLISGPSPEYTPQALERRVEGTMVIRCVISVDGTVHGCRVVKSLPFMDRAAVTALERRKYKPALRAGQPVDVYYTFTLTFELP